MKFLSFFFLALITISCQQSSNHLFVFKPISNFENKVSLSDIADDITYIPLKISAPIGIIYSVRINEFGIFMSIKDLGILRFDKQGKLINEIAHKGKGPNEFHYGMFFTVNETNGDVFVADREKIKIYTKEGKFCRNINYRNFLSTTAHSIELLGSNIFITNYGTQITSKYDWFVIDSIGDPIRYKKNKIKPKGFYFDGCTYKFQNKLFFYNYSNDTIFSVDPNLNIVGEYVFEPGSHRWPSEGMAFPPPPSLIREKFRPLQMLQTKCYVFLYYAFKDENKIIIHEKSSQKSFQAFEINKNTNSGLKTKACFTNDLDIGLSLGTRPFLYYYCNKNIEYLVTIINPYDLKAQIASEAFKNSTPKYPKKKKELEKLANSLNENDNPVLMLVKLKE